jgi:serine/threonine protein kinase
VVDMFEVNNRGYYVLPYFEGGSLEKFLQWYTEPRMEDLTKIFVPLIDAMAYLENKCFKNIFDITPSNIFISTDWTPMLYAFKNSFSKEEPNLLYGISACMYLAITGKAYNNSRNNDDNKNNIILSDNSRYKYKYGSKILRLIDNCLIMNNGGHNNTIYDLRKVFID